MANIVSTLTYNAQLGPAQAQIKALTGQVGALTAAFNTLDKSAVKSQASLAATFAANVGQVGGFTTKMVQLNTTVESFGKSIEAGRLTMGQYFREAYRGLTRQNSLMRQLAAQQVRYQQSIMVPMGTGPGGAQAMMLTPTHLNATTKSLQMASQRMSIFNELIMGGSDRLLNFGKNTQWTGRQLMVGFTVPLAMFSALVSKHFREMDKELTRFEKVYGEDLGSQVAETTKMMRREVQELAFEMSRSFGIASKETAALAADFAQTGKEGQDLIDAVRLTTRLSVLGDLERQDAMKTTLSIQNAFKKDTNELAQTINFLNAVENQTIANIQDLSTAIPRVGPVIQALGGDVDDLAVLLVAMKEGGVSAAEGANALKASLGRIINPTKRATEVAAQFGVNLTNIVEGNRGQLMPMILELQGALKNLDSFARAQVIEQVFGKFQFARMSALFENLKREGSQTNAVLGLASKSSSELAAIANQELKVLQESLSTKFQRRMEELKNTLIPLGAIMTETLLPIFSALSKGAQMFSDFFDRMPDGVKSVTKIGLILVGLTGPVVMLVGLFGNLVANGIKFGMMIVRLAAKMAGIPIKRFELLNEETVAAARGVETLTGSFVSQESALKRLVRILNDYNLALKNLVRSQPNLFIPGAVPVGSTRSGATVPIRRQAGSRSAEFVPGSGRGDKIPAMLEPGEFIVNRSATEKYAPILVAMNKGLLKGFNEGGMAGPIGLRGGPAKAYSPFTMFAPGNTSEGFGMSRGFFESSEMFELSMRASAVTALGIQKNISLTDDVVRSLSTEVSPATKKITEALRQTAQEMSESGQSATHISEILDQARPKIMSIISKLDDPQQKESLRKLLYPTKQEVLDMGYRRVPGVTVDPQTGDPTRTPSRYDVSFGEARSFKGRLRGVAEKLGVPQGTYGGERWTMAHLDMQRYEAEMIPESGGALGASEEVRQRARALLEEFIDSLTEGVHQAVQPGSPSRVVDEKFYSYGQAIGSGAIQGLERGFREASKGSKIMPGPVGSGIESIGNAQKIAQADQSILRFKELQQKYIADRVRAEVEMSRIDKLILENKTKYARGEISIVQMKENERKLLAQRSEEEKKQSTAAQMESRIQKSINDAKERIRISNENQAVEEEKSLGLLRQSRFGDMTPEERKMLAQARRQGLDPTTVGRYQAGLERRQARLSEQGVGPQVSDIENTRGPGSRLQAFSNIAFMSTMLVSTLSMTGVASSDLSSKLGMLSAAVMTATMAMNMFSGKNVAGNFLGLGGLGQKITGLGAARAGAAGAGAASSSVLGVSSRVLPTFAAAKGIGGSAGALMMAGRAISILGGPVGIAAGIAVTGIIAAIMKYRSELEEARERAIAAFSDPIKTAEYFGETITNIGKILERNKLSNIVKEDVEAIDEGLREAVKEDYGKLIENISQSTAGLGARELSNAYSSMIISGMTAENAKAAVQAIAIEAGEAGGNALAEAMKNRMIQFEGIEEAIEAIVGNVLPDRDPFSLLSGLQKQLNEALEKEQSLRKEYQESNNGVEGVVPRFITGEGQQLVEDLNAAEREAQNLRNEIQLLSEINLDQLSKTFEQLTLAYAKAPEQVVKSYEDIIKSVRDSGQDLEPVLREFLETHMPEDLEKYGHLLNSTEKYAVAVKMAIAGIDFRHAINGAGVFSTVLAQAAVNAVSLADAAAMAAREAREGYESSFFEMAEEERSKLQSRRIEIEENLQTKLINLEKKIFGARKENVEKEMQLSNQASQWRIDDISRVIDAIRKELDAEKEKQQEKIDSLNEEKQKITESTSAYIDSIKKRQRVDSHYANQRKTAFSALQKLASGDVFGFLQERESMSEQAQQFAFEEEIKQIEDKRDAELQLIDDKIEKQREEFEQYEKMMQEKIKSQQDLIDAEREVIYWKNRNHQEALNQFEKEKTEAEKTAQSKVKSVDKQLSDISSAEEKFRTNSMEGEKALSKVLGEEKTRPLIDQRKEMVKNMILDLYMRGNVTLGAAARSIMNQVGAFVGTADRSTSDISGFLRDLGFDIGTPRRRSGALGLDSIYNPNEFRPELDPGSGLDPNQVNINSPDNVYINGVNVDGGGTNDNEPYTQPGTTGATGGYISGPGTSTSDSIPARLSNGEYVIRASSVQKYGKDMMDSINTARFAVGGYVSADRAAYAAEQRRPPPLLRKPQAPPPLLARPQAPPPRPVPTRGPGLTYPSASMDYNTIFPGDPTDAPSLWGRELLGGMWQGFRNELAGASSFAGFGILRPFGIPAMLAGQSQEEYAKVSEQEKALNALLFGTNFIPIPGLAAIKGAAKSAMFSAKTVTSPPMRAPITTNLRTIPNSPVFGLGAVDKPLGSQIDLGMPVDPMKVLGTVAADSTGLGRHYGISPGGYFMGPRGLSYAKSFDSPDAAYAEALSAFIHKELGGSSVVPSLIKIGDTSVPWKKFGKGEHGEFLPEQLVSVSHVRPNFIKQWNQIDPAEKIKLLMKDSHLDTLLDNMDLHSGNIIFPRDSKTGLLTPTRFDFGSNPWTMYGTPTPFFPDNVKFRAPMEASTLAARDFTHIKTHGAEIKNKWNELYQQSVQGRIRRIIERFVQEQGAATGLYPRNPDTIVKLLEERMKKDLSLPPIPSYVGNNTPMPIGIAPSPKEAFLWNPGPVASAFHLAKGGLVGDIKNIPGFKDGGPVGDSPRSLRALPKFIEHSTWPTVLPDPPPTGESGAGGYGMPTTPGSTSTSLISHPSQGGPNNWPYSKYQSARGIIPGTNKSVSLNKDVLPLFLAFASDYNKLIRPINTIYGIGDRTGSNISNHPSGTAVDINPSDEGVYFGWQWVTQAKKQAVLDWWAGKKSPLAPWKSKSRVPKDTVRSLMNKYKVLQWFGPEIQGGFIRDTMGQNDPMHFQITQSRTVSPTEVASTIGSLGINPDGRFNSRVPGMFAGGPVRGPGSPKSDSNLRWKSALGLAAGGAVRGPGGPKSDSIPAMLSNGEYVVKADSVKKYGKPTLDAINSGRLKLAEGGMVGPSMSIPSLGPALSSAGGVTMPSSLSAPSFNMPNNTSVSSINGGSMMSSGGSNAFSTSNNVKIVINGTGNSSSAALANKVVKMINSSIKRRDFSRSA